MTQPRRDAKWWGWGEPAKVPELDDAAREVLRGRIGELEPWPLARELASFELPQAQELPRALVEAVGEENVFAGAEDRRRRLVARRLLPTRRQAPPASTTWDEHALDPPLRRQF